MTRTSNLPVALGAVATAALLAAWGTFGDETHATREYLVVLAIIGVATLAVFGWAVPRAVRSETIGRTAVVLGVLGVVTVLVFWSGLPPIFASGAAVLGWSQRDGRRGKIAIGLSMLALLGYIAVYLADRL
jgi:hypothetical protein